MLLLRKRLTSRPRKVQAVAERAYPKASNDPPAIGLVAQAGNQPGDLPKRFGTQTYDPAPSQVVTEGLYLYDVLPAVLHGKRAARRRGWNGKGMYIFYVPGSTFTVEPGRPMAAFIPVGRQIQYHGHIDMMTAQGYVIPWLASQADQTEADWELVPEDELN